MKRIRAGFVVEQALGHVAYGMALRQALADRTDMDIVWVEVPFTPAAAMTLPPFRNNWTLRGSAIAARKLQEVVAHGGVDALFIHTQTVSLFAGGYMQRIPTLLSLDATPVNVDSLATAYQHRRGAPPVEAFKRWAHTRVMRHARHFTTWSEWAKRSLVDDYGVRSSDITVIHPGTSLGAFSSAERGLRSPSSRLQVLFVGGDFTRKGGDVLLQAYRSGLQEHCDLHIVSGSGPPPEPGVRVYRNLRPHSEELRRLYADADAFVLPTRGDCLAVVLGEAMAASLPIITTRVGAHAEAVIEGENGFLIDVDDASSLFDRLMLLHRDRELAIRMGESSRSIAEDRFDMNKGAQRIADILVALAHDRPALAREPMTVAPEGVRS